MGSVAKLMTGRIWPPPFTRLSGVDPEVSLDQAYVSPHAAAVPFPELILRPACEAASPRDPTIINPVNGLRRRSASKPRAESQPAAWASSPHIFYRLHHRLSDPPRRGDAEEDFLRASPSLSTPGSALVVIAAFAVNRAPDTPASQVRDGRAAFRPCSPSGTGRDPGGLARPCRRSRRPGLGHGWSSR